MSPDELSIVYHVYAVGEWRTIAEEQLALVAECQIHCSFIGTKEKLEEFRAIADRYQITLTTRLFEDPTVYEHEAMRWIEKLAVSNPSGYTIYFHTKGVTSGKTEWCNYLNSAFLAQKERIFRKLKRSGKDVAGALYSHLPMSLANGETISARLFAGNFWMAANRYLLTLPPYDELRDRFDHDRFLAEFYIGFNRPSVVLLNQSRPYEDWDIFEIIRLDQYNPGLLFNLRRWWFRLRIKWGWEPRPSEA